MFLFPSLKLIFDNNKGKRKPTDFCKTLASLKLAMAILIAMSRGFTSFM